MRSRGIWLELLPPRRKRRLSDDDEPPRPSCYSPRSTARFKYKCEERELDKSLCLRCRTIDFEAIFDLEPTERVTNDGVAVFHLGQLPTFTQDIECRLCKLFALIVDRNQKYDENNGPEWQKSWHLRAFTTGTLWDKSHAETSRANKLSIVVALARGSTLFLENADNKADCIDRGVILPHQNSLGSKSKYSTPCQIAKCDRRVRFDSIKTALADCDTSHSTCKTQEEQAMDFPVNASVIDCRSRKVVKLKPTMDYVALSYVWGRKQKDGSHAHKNGVLPGRLPLTIEDAMRVTIGLEKRYLWIDRYCIDQGHGKNNQQQIRQMANIYSNAIATICALGDDDKVCIPGISTDRKKQLHVELQNVALSWTGPGLRRRLQSSKWSDRGWTYQELVLSRRCLFFTDYYSVVACGKENWTENILFTHFESPTFSKGSFLLRDVSDLGQVLSPAQEFYVQIQAYQSRQLSFVTDSLDAFKGILSRLPVQSYWGIPIYSVLAPKKDTTRPVDKEREAGFITGICWKVEDAGGSVGQTRKSFPSWSWVGLKHTGLLANCLAESMHMEVSSSRFSTFQASVSVKSKTDKVVGIEKLSKLCANVRLIPEQTQYLEVTSVMTRWYYRVNPEPVDDSHEKERVVAYQVTNNGWWQSNCLGNLYLDPLEDGHTDESDQSVRREGVVEEEEGEKGTKVMALQSGPAMLLALEEVPPPPGKTRTIVRAVWLVMVKVADGTFRRKGIIVSNEMDQHRASIGPPPPALLKTITLG